METTISLYADSAEVTRLQAARLLADGTAVTIYELIADGGQKVLEHIEVYPRRRAFGDIKGAQVNWAGIGSQGAAKARRYAEMLILAAELIELSDMIAAEAAATATAEHGVSRVVAEAGR